MEKDTTFSSYVADSRTIPAVEDPRGSWVQSAAAYEERYEASIENPQEFWAEAAREHLHWEEPWDEVVTGEMSQGTIRWFTGGKTNVAYNAIDRHLDSGTRNKAAIIWEGDNGRTKIYTYQSLYYKMNRFANVLRKHGIGKGDRVVIYLPNIPELPVAMLACARIGAIHAVVSPELSWQALRDRIQHSDAKMLITADETTREGRIIQLKTNADAALRETPSVKSTIVVSSQQARLNMEPGRDHWYHVEINEPDIKRECPVEWVDASDPLFISYTSGSTGKPKGIVHGSGGYPVYAMETFRDVFDYHESDVFFCTASISWITGHTYLVYAPLLSGATTVLYEGTMSYPRPGRFWEIIEKHGVNQFYTTPSHLRTAMQEGDDVRERYDLDQLKVLGTTGEPITPEVWNWFHDVIGAGTVPIVDTWWQSETGGVMLTTFPSAIPMKAGASGLPMFGVSTTIVDEDGQTVPNGSSGHLTITDPWPGMMLGLWDDSGNVLLREGYLDRFPDLYYTGDLAVEDSDGYHWLLGRVDDIITQSGLRLSTAEVEAALSSHKAVCEVAVVTYPREIVNGLYAFVVVNEGYEASADLRWMLRGHVRNRIGAAAVPDMVQFVPAIPRTRSGKVLHRVLRKVAAGVVSPTAFGDISTMADPDLLIEIVEGAAEYRAEPETL